MIADFIVFCPVDFKLIWKGDTTQELLQLFATVRTENDIQAFQKNTILDDGLPDVQAFLQSPANFFQIYLYIYTVTVSHNSRYASMKCAISLMLEKNHGYRKYAKILIDMHENCKSPPKI